MWNAGLLAPAGCRVDDLQDSLAASPALPFLAGAPCGAGGVCRVVVLLAHHEHTVDESSPRPLPSRGLPATPLASLFSIPFLVYNI